MADLVTLSEYATLDRPNVEFLIPDTVPKPGLVVLVGAPGAGKSFMALQMALAVAQGGKFWKQQAKQGNVLYFQFDMGEMVVRNRMQQLQAAGVNIAGPVFTLHPGTAPTSINVMNPFDVAILRDAITKANPELVIFDVLREMHNADEDSSTEMKPVGDTIMDLVKGRACLVLHHAKKMSGFEPSAIDASRGTTYLTGKADVVWMLHDGYFYVGKSRIGPGGKYRVKRQKNGLWEFD